MIIKLHVTVIVAVLAILLGTLPSLALIRADSGSDNSGGSSDNGGNSGSSDSGNSGSSDNGGGSGSSDNGGGSSSSGHDICPDPGHCTCINGVLHDDLMQFPINDGCRTNSDGSITN